MPRCQAPPFHGCGSRARLGVIPGPRRLPPLRRGTLRLVAVVAPLHLFIAAVLLWRAGAPGMFGGDFLAYATAGHLVAAGGFGRVSEPAALTAWHHGYGHLYDLAAQQQFQRPFLAAGGLAAQGLAAVPFNYPPPAALVFLPLAALPLRPALLLWTVLNAALALLALDRLARAARPGHRLDARARLLGAGLACAVLPLDWGLLAGQPVGLVLLLGALAYLALRDGRDARAGLALALLAALKPQLALAPILGLVALRRWRSLVAVFAGGAALRSLSLLLADPAALDAYLHLLRQMDGFRGDSALAVGTGAMPNWRAWVARWPGLGDGAAAALTTALDALTLLPALALCARRPAGPAFARAYLALTAAGIAGSYPSHYQDLVLLLPPLLTLVAPATATAPVSADGAARVPRSLAVSRNPLAPPLPVPRPGDVAVPASPPETVRLPAQAGSPARRACLALAALLLAAPGLAWLALGVLALGRLDLWVALAGPGLLLLLAAAAWPAPGRPGHGAAVRPHPPARLSRKNAAMRASM